MKITTFDPIILTNNFDQVVSLFEALGFEKKHAPRWALKRSMRLSPTRASGTCAPSA